jgi:PST family polysaccharide transporter
MTLVSAVLGPMVFLSIRKNIILNLGIEQAGYWEAMGRISSYYFLFVSTIIGLYFLPKLTLAKSNQETKSLFWEYYKGILPVFIVGLIGIYFFREVLVQLLFTKEFLPVSKLFFWQLVGDVFKAASLILGYQFFAQKLTKAFIVFELFSLAILYFSSIYFVSIRGIEGVVMAHSFTYAVYLIVLSIYFRKSL